MARDGIDDEFAFFDQNQVKLSTVVGVTDLRETVPALQPAPARAARFSTLQPAPHASARSGTRRHAPARSGAELDAPPAFSETPRMYRIVGADQKEYGPVSADQVRQWIAEGRANGQTLLRFEDGPWKPLSTFPEFASALPSSPPPLAGSVAPPPLASGGGTPVRTNGFATAGLVFGVLGLLQCCTPMFAVLGIILSSIGLYQISQDPARQTGKPLAIAGLVTSVLGLLLFSGLFFSGVLHELVRHLRNLP